MEIIIALIAIIAGILVYTIGIIVNLCGKEGKKVKKYGIILTLIGGGIIGWVFLSGMLKIILCVSIIIFIFFEKPTEETSAETTSES